MNGTIDYLKKITVVFFGEKSYFESEEIQKMIPEELFEKVETFQTIDDFDVFYEKNQNANLLLIVFIHVEAATLAGYNSKIQLELKKYKNLVIRWVTRTNSDIIGKKIHQPRNTYTYREIYDGLMDRTLVPQKISDIKSIERKRNQKHIVPFIFFSHSSKDEKVVNAFFKHILRLGHGIPKRDFLITSNNSTSLITGTNIPNGLRRALQKMTIFIQYVSKNYKESEVCLNEMGAAWIKLSKRNIIVLKAPDIKFNEIGFLNLTNIGIDITNRKSLEKLFIDHKELFKNVDISDFNEGVSSFLRYINKAKKGSL